MSGGAAYFFRSVEHSFETLEDKTAKQKKRQKKKKESFIFNVILKFIMIIVCFNKPRRLLLPMLVVCHTLFVILRDVSRKTIYFTFIAFPVASNLK